VFVAKVTRQVSYVEQELLILPEHLSTPPGFSGVLTARSLVFSAVICRLLFVFFLLATALSGLLRMTASGYHHTILKQLIF